MDSNEELNLIFQTEHWRIILKPDQKYLGKCVVRLKRKCGDLAELTQEEILDFLEVVKKTESLFRKTFNATMFNWTCLMNNAYQLPNPDPQIHWHFRPRYNHQVKFGDEVFVDPNFGHHYLSLDIEEVLPREVLDKIVVELQKNL